MNLTDKRFHDSRKARKWLEEQRWPDGVQCTHCQSFSITPLTGKKHRKGLYQCNDCRKQFTVTTGSVMERSRLPLNKWVAAMYMMASSKKGVSAHQLHRTLGITYQSAWFLAHRIREAMRDDAPSMIGGGGEIVEADETYHGKPETPHVSPHRKGRPYKYAAKGPRNSRPIVSLVERGGRVRTFHVAVADKVNVTEIVRSNVARESRLHTDDTVDKVRLVIGREP